MTERRLKQYLLNIEFLLNTDPPFVDEMLQATQGNGEFLLPDGTELSKYQFIIIRMAWGKYKVFAHHDNYLCWLANKINMAIYNGHNVEFCESAIDDGHYVFNDHTTYDTFSLPKDAMRICETDD